MKHITKTSKKRSPPLRTRTLSLLCEYWEIISQNLDEYEESVADCKWSEAVECKKCILRDLPAVRRLTKRLFKVYGG